MDPGSGELTARLTITLENGAPPGGLSDYLIGTGPIPTHPTGTNRLYLSVYTPWVLGEARTGR